MKIYDNIGELVGKTPLVRLARIEKKHGLMAKLVAKVERFNPGGSIKDRVALHIISEAERRGEILPGRTTLIEPTSGNTGIGIAMVAAVRGYRCIIVMPENMSEERKRLISSYGAELVLTSKGLGMKGAIAEAERIKASIPDGYILGQFTNSDNPTAHKLSTGPEIYEDTEGELDIFVSAVGTGGTLSGVGAYLKERKPEVEIVCVEPRSSAVISGGKSGAHKIQGIGAGFIPEVLDLPLIDRVITVDDGEAIACAGELAREEGLLVGISSGAALSAAIALAKESENLGKTIVLVLPDTGERYLSVDE